MLGERRGRADSRGGVGGWEELWLPSFHPSQSHFSSAVWQNTGKRNERQRRKGSVANVTASICRPVSCVSRTTSSNLISKGTRQCPGNLFLLNNFFPFLLFDQTSLFYKIAHKLSHTFALNVNKADGLDCELWAVEVSRGNLWGSYSMDSIATVTL